MKTYAELKNMFGQAMAKELRTRKKEMEEKRPADQPQWWMPHPDFPQSQETHIAIIAWLMFFRGVRINFIQLYPAVL